MNIDAIVERVRKIPSAVPIYRGLKCCITAPFDASRSKRAVASIIKGDFKGATYYDLYGTHNTDKYLRYLKMVHRFNEKRLRKKVEKGETVKVAFQTAFLSTWIGDSILDKFANDDRFEVTVVLVRQTNASKTEINNLKEHFKGRTERVLFADGLVHPGDFDIVFYTSPYLSALENWGDKEIPLSTLVCYTQYGFSVIGRQMSQFNLFIHGIVWRNYALTKLDAQLARKYCRIGDYGMVFSGYPKMDNAYNLRCSDEACWKIADGSEAVKKIIYAPHHSIDGDPYLSTFVQNKDFMLEYAKEHIHNTSWVYKPHPLLRIQAVKTGVYKSVAEYDRYVDEWRNLPNAVVVEGQYLPYMSSSDALILDSGSFLAEYVYFHKPLLFLTRKGEKFSELGQVLIENLYTVPGNDFSGIRHFIEETIDADPMAGERDAFFCQYLDYFAFNGMLASEYIYRDIADTLAPQKT